MSQTLEQTAKKHSKFIVKIPLSFNFFANPISISKTNLYSIIKNCIYLFQVCADTIKAVLGVYLKIPIETRWNSTLVALTQLLSLYDNKAAEIRNVYEHCNLSEHFLKREHLNFLRKYIKVPLVMHNKLPEQLILFYIAGHDASCESS